MVTNDSEVLRENTCLERIRTPFHGSNWFFKETASCTFRIMPTIQIESSSFGEYSDWDFIWLINSSCFSHSITAISFSINKGHHCFRRSFIPNWIFSMPWIASWWRSGNESVPHAIFFNSRMLMLSWMKCNHQNKQSQTNMQCVCFIDLSSWTIPT